MLWRSSRQSQEESECGPLKVINHSPDNGLSNLDDQSHLGNPLTMPRPIQMILMSRTSVGLQATWVFCDGKDIIQAGCSRGFCISEDSKNLMMFSVRIFSFSGCPFYALYFILWLCLLMQSLAKRRDNGSYLSLQPNNLVITLLMGTGLWLQKKMKEGRRGLYLSEENKMRKKNNKKETSRGDLLQIKYLATFCWLECECVVDVWTHVMKHSQTSLQIENIWEVC